MSKTYSIAILNEKGIWITNWHTYSKVEDINFDEVEKYCLESGCIGYGYYYGEKSNNLTSERCRTVMKVLGIPTYTIESALKTLRSSDGKIFYTGLDEKIKWLKIKYEDVGYTFLFGNETSDKVIQKRWYINGNSDLLEFLKNNLGLS